MRHASDSENDGSGDDRRGRGARQPERRRERRSPARSRSRSRSRSRDRGTNLRDELFAYLEAQFGNQQRENADLRRQLKRAESKETTFKYKGHELQYKFNSSLEEKMDELESAIRWVFFGVHYHRQAVSPYRQPRPSNLTRYNISCFPSLLGRLNQPPFFLLSVYPMGAGKIPNSNSCRKSRQCWPDETN